MELLIAGLALGSGLAILGFLVREAGLSRRLSLPLWVADAGLALMGAAIAAWLLTAAVASADLERTPGIVIVGVGSLVVAIAGFILARRATSMRRAVAFQSGSRTALSVVTTSNVIETTTSESAEPDAEPVAESGAEPGETDGEEPVDIGSTTPKRDWEAIWRETWGSGELPRNTSGQIDQPEPAGGDDEARLSWTESAEHEETKLDRITANGGSPDETDQVEESAVGVDSSDAKAG